MECNQQESLISVTKTLYENFLEEKCETDFIIPDYYPAVEKIIHCSAYPVICKKEIVGDRLSLEGTCKITVIYHGENDEGVKSLFETIRFEESLPLKESGNHPWVQTAIRMGAVSCRMLNPRKLNCKATASIAVKVKDCQSVELIGAADCETLERLYETVSVYTAIDHPCADTKVMGEIEVHTPIQDILKMDGFVSVIDVKVAGNKAVAKCVLNLFILFTCEADPKKVEATSTAIPFTQILELENSSEGCSMEVNSSIQNVRADVEVDREGKNKVIAVTATVQTEGEVYLNVKRELLVDAYSNHFPVELTESNITLEEMVEHGKFNETLLHTVAVDPETTEIIQVTSFPTIQKISGQRNEITIEGVMDTSIVMKRGEHNCVIDKCLSFTLSKELKRLDSRMRCEIYPVIVSASWDLKEDQVEIKTELSCSMVILARNEFKIITDVHMDEENSLPLVHTAPLVVYYGEKGERLWDIARRYCTSVSSIKAVNQLEKDRLEEKKLLLISRS